MKILLTNDDGISAPGLACLARTLAPEHSVYVVAPDRERSGVSHAFTLHEPLEYGEASGFFDGIPVKQAWQCSGTPTDCVKMALLAILADDPPDLVVSGINRGANMAVDHLYSGTVAGAMEAVIGGLAAIAVSVELNRDGEQYFETAAKAVYDFIGDPSTRGLLSSEYMLNINAPALPPEKVRGRRFTCVGRCCYDDRYRVEKDESGAPSEYWLEGRIRVLDERPWADIVAVRAGYVSVCPMAPDLTAHDVLERFRTRRDA